MNKADKYIEPAKELEVYGSYDVIVVGGGCAGFAAALASARNGAKTLIIERFPYFGGTATASLMTNINGFRNQVEPDHLQTSKGIAEEIILKLKEMDGLGQSPYPQKQYPDVKGALSYSFAIDPEKFKFATLKMIVEAGAEILFHTYFSNVIKEGNQVKGIIFENKSGRQVAFGKVVVDASGDGDVAFRAGVSFWQVRHDEESRLNDSLMYKIVGFDEAGENVGCRINETAVVWGPGAEPIDGTDARELTEAEIQTRLHIFQDLETKKKNNPVLKNAKVVETGPLLGVRQTRFIEGLYKLTGEDILEGKRFEDTIALASCPIIHYYGYRRYLEHEGYDIPYRCLLPQNIKGLLAAGRCISSDQRAYESWRAMAPVMSIGEAAGTAAALSALHNVSPEQLDVKMLQKRLMEQGAEIGQGRS